MSSYQMAKSLSLKTRSISYLPNLSVLIQRVRTIVQHTLTGANQNLPLPTLASDSSEDSCHSLATNEDFPHRGIFPEISKAVPNLFLFENRFPLPKSDNFVSLDSPTQSDVCDALFDTNILKLETNPIEIPSNDAKVEMLVQESPAFLTKSFMELMPDIKELSGNKLSVVCISERTLHDMSNWSLQMSQEREELTRSFINSAKEICTRIEEFGFWADFVDPSSGLPYNGTSGSDHFMETDERLRHFGFTIEDLGCCKCLRHSTWGTHIFMGVILTTAPTNSSIITRLMKL